MTLYRKKPVPVAASQWFKDGDHPAVQFLAADSRFRQLAGMRPEQGWCPTLEGGHVVTPGDWIITGVRGEHYPCKPDIFTETYELATGEPSDADIDKAVEAWNATAGHPQFAHLIHNRFEREQMRAALKAVHS